MGRRPEDLPSLGAELFKFGCCKVPITTSVSTEIAVRLPESLVAWVDEQVAGDGSSQSAVTTPALRRYQRQLTVARDTQIYREKGGYPELEEWVWGSVRIPNSTRRD